jgi:MarR family transcriptional regulator, organic hydroperoxide resistance regulator
MTTTNLPVKTSISIWDKKFRIADVSIGYLLWELNNRVETSMNKILADFDLTRFQFLVLKGLMTIRKHNLRFNQRDFASFINSNPMMVSKVIRQMEKDGLVVRLGNKVDTRAKQLEITAKGENLFLNSLKKVKIMSAHLESQVAVDVQEFKNTLDNLIDFLTNQTI